MIDAIRARIGTPEVLLILMTVVAALAFSVWEVLLNNFAFEWAAFTGREIGILHSRREVPGLLAFTAVLILQYGLAIESLKLHPPRFVIPGPAGIIVSLNVLKALDREIFKQGLREVVA